VSIDNPSRPTPTLPDQGPRHGGDREPPPLFDIPPLIERAQKAFRRDLPELLPDRYRQWVAYHGDDCVGFSDSQFDLYDECVRRGYPEDEFLVQCITADVEEVDPTEFLDR
jgi:hypothetical protein